ncbi:CFEM domain-containing protein [Microdochium nivale]|nr:CFEM domain-containing protein [Microdochium nivale]
MRFTITAASLFAALAAAQTGQDDNTSTSNQSLAQLISQLPTCAKSCFTSAAKNAGCGISDFQCICIDKRSDFITSITPCVFLTSGCSPSDTSAATDVATDFCHKMYASPNSTELQAATSAINAALGTPSPTGTQSQPANPTGAAVRPAAGFGLLGAAVLAALAI